MTTPLASTDKGAVSEALDLVMDIPVEITVELGGAEMSLRDVVHLSPGSIIELNKRADEPVNLYVNRKLVAKGEVVLVENNLGIKITHVTGTDQNDAESGKIGSP
jgi:flagellar motor switch protein FliN